MSSTNCRNEKAPGSVSHTVKVYNALPQRVACGIITAQVTKALPQCHLCRATRRRDATTSINITILSYCQYLLALFVVLYPHLTLSLLCRNCAISNAASLDNQGGSHIGGSSRGRTETASQLLLHHHFYRIG